MLGGHPWQRHLASELHPCRPQALLIITGINSAHSLLFQWPFAPARRTPWAQLESWRSSTTSPKRYTPAARSWWATLRSPWWRRVWTSPSCGWVPVASSSRFRSTQRTRSPPFSHSGWLTKQGAHTSATRTFLRSTPHACLPVIDFSFSRLCLDPTVDQGGDGLHPAGRQQFQPCAAGQPARHQRQRAVREPVRAGRHDQLPERGEARPPGAGPDSPYRYAGSGWLIVCAEGGGSVDKTSARGVSAAGALTPTQRCGRPHGRGGSCDVWRRKCLALATAQLSVGGEPWGVCVWCGWESAAGRVAGVLGLVPLIVFCCLCLCATRRDSAGRSQDHQEQGPELRPQRQLAGHREGRNRQHHHLWQRAWEWVTPPRVAVGMTTERRLTSNVVTNCLCVLEPCHEACGEVPCWGPGSDVCQICEWAKGPNVRNAKTINVRGNEQEPKTQTPPETVLMLCRLSWFDLWPPVRGQTRVHPTLLLFWIAPVVICGRRETTAIVCFSDKDRVRPPV